jgi:hypothetical protein
MSEVVATVVRDVSPGLSGAEAALYGGLGGGLIGGILALLGVVVERVLRFTGFLRSEVSEWEWRFVSGDTYNREVLSPDDEAATTAERVEFTFAVDLFNGRELPTGLPEIEDLPIVAVVVPDSCPARETLFPSPTG